MAPRQALRVRGEVRTGLVARSWTGWVILVLGTAAFVGALGPWVETEGATVNGGVLDGRWAALSATVLVALGVLIVLGLGYWWICLLGIAAGGITFGYGLTGYSAGADLFQDASTPGWGLPVCVGAGAAAGVLSGVAVALRSPFSRTFDGPVRIVPARSTASYARSEPDAGTALLILGVVGVIGSLGPWTRELIPPDQYGLDGDGVLTVLTSAAVAACGLAIMRGLGRLWISIVALVCAAGSLFVSFVDYASVQRLTRGIVIHGGEFYSVAWGLYLLLAASIGSVGIAIRAVSRRGVIVTGSAAA